MLNHLPIPLPHPRIPRATYRLQFNAEFTFSQAEALVPYLADLGISDCYASPLQESCPGSTHGYDICNHSQINPILGGEAGFQPFSAALRRHGLGLLLDIVPNHMGIVTPDNAWWLDVLENGPGSLYAAYFDVDWQPVKPELENKVLLPILEDQYGQVLESGKLRLVFEQGAFFIDYYTIRLPIAPRTYRLILADALAQLTDTLDEADEYRQEFESIMTALNYLPPRDTGEPEKLAERNREKEVIKRRLANLCEQSSEVLAAIEDSVSRHNGRVGEPRSFDRLDALLDGQPYRPAFWRVAAEEINYRRFFDINGLAAIRVELPEVFAATHELPFRLLASGQVTGLRVDHPDGLWDPPSYFQQLQVQYILSQWAASTEPTHDLPSPEEVRATLPVDRPPLYVVAEKILSEQEVLPRDWAVYGTTGYDFLNQVNNLFVDSRHRRVFDRIYSRFIGSPVNFDELVKANKQRIMRLSMSSEINALSHQLERITEKNRRYRDFTLNSVVRAIEMIIAGLPIYRTYITGPGIVSEWDHHYIELAVNEARQRNPRLPGSLLRFMRDTLLLRNLDQFPEEERSNLVAWVMKFQQLSGPVMAKGLEDTSFYSYNRLVSLNEVGSHPQQFGLPVEEFHRQNLARHRDWPHSMLATSTHDTKRSEDVRARLNVLSEIPGEWQAALARWRRLNTGYKTVVDGQPAPDRNDEYLFYQTVLGAWPLAEKPTGAPGSPLLLDPAAPEFADFRDRIVAYMEKATREAKVHTSWMNPNETYDEALRRFVERALTPGRRNRFLNGLPSFLHRVAYFGQFNSLAQLLLKLTSPGVPDLYQGTELWDFSLVDPDNRRPVDYDHRRRFLAELRSRLKQDPRMLVEELLECSQDGRIKLYLVERSLNLRRDYEALFTEGEYLPLAATGPKQEHTCAFARTLAGQMVVVIVPRLVVSLTGGLEQPPTGPEVWGDTRLELPPDTRTGERYRSIFTGETFTVDPGQPPGLPLAPVLGTFPVALLIHE